MTHEKVRKKFFKENISSLKKCTDFDFIQWHVVVFQRERHVHCSVHYPASIIFLKTYQKNDQQMMLDLFGWLLIY